MKRYIYRNTISLDGQPDLRFLHSYFLGNRARGLRANEFHRLIVIVRTSCLIARRMKAQITARVQAKIPTYSRSKWGEVGLGMEDSGSLQGNVSESVLSRPYSLSFGW
jgi:hypothetical protein